MTIQKILVPDMGDFKDVEVIEVLVKKGQVIKKNESLITLESDKSSVEVPSTHEGKIEKINVSVGDKINKGDLILTLESKQETNEPVKEPVILLFATDESLTKLSTVALPVLSVEVPLSMFPKPLVIEPASNAPTSVICV